MRSKHTDQATASQGMKQYLATCSRSGLPAMKAIAARYDALPKAERLPLYLSDFGSHFEKASPTSPKEVNDISAVLTTEQIDALVALGLMEAPVVEAPAASLDTSAWKKGVRFSFTAQNGNVREHVVTRVAKGRVFTDQGQDFSIEKALLGYAADRVTIL